MGIQSKTDKEEKYKTRKPNWIASKNLSRQFTKKWTYLDLATNEKLMLVKKKILMKLFCRTSKHRMHMKDYKVLFPLLHYCFISPSLTLSSFHKECWKEIM